MAWGFAFELILKKCAKKEKYQQDPPLLHPNTCSGEGPCPSMLVAGSANDEEPGVSSLKFIEVCATACHRTAT